MVNLSEGLNGINIKVINFSKSIINLKNEQIMKKILLLGSHYIVCDYLTCTARHNQP